MRIVAIPEAWQQRALVITEVDRPERWFSAMELARADAFTLEKRRTEWMLARIAAKELARQRGLCEDPRAFVVERAPTISLSHGGGYGAAAIDVEPVGIDIERHRDIKPSAAHLFLTEEEEAEARHCSMERALLHFWSAKEAAWKQRSGEVPTLKKIPLHLVAQRDDGLTFDRAETYAGEIVVALTTTTS